MKKIPKEVLERTSLLQSQCFEFIDELVAHRKKTKVKTNNKRDFYQEAVNAWFYLKLAELQIKNETKK